MPEALSQIDEPVAQAPESVPEPAAAPEPTAADLDKMTLPQLEALAKGEPKPAEKPKDAPVQPAQTPAEKWIELAVNDRKMRYRNDEEVRKALVESQKYIQKVNGERGKYGSIAKEHEKLKADYATLQQQLQQGAAQIRAGQTPNTATQQALAPLQRQQPNATSNQELEEIRQQLAELRQERAEQKVDIGVKTLYREIDKFIDNHKEYKLSQDFEKIDQIISDNPEAAKANLGEEDLAKYNAIFEVVSLYKPKTADGHFDIGGKNFEDFEEAFLIYQKRNGSLAQQQTAAFKSGMQNFETALTRGANSATTLPNSQTSTPAPKMGPAEMEQILSMDNALIMADPELQKKFIQAAEAAGIAPSVVSQMLKKT